MLCSKAGACVIITLTHITLFINIKITKKEKVVADPSREEELEFNYRMPKFNDGSYFSFFYFLIMPSLKKVEDRQQLIVVINYLMGTLSNSYFLISHLGKSIDSAFNLHNTSLVVLGSKPRLV